MISDETSLRLKTLRFPLIVGVVFIHSSEVTVGFQDGQVGVANAHTVLDFVRNLISQGIAGVAVPLFFLMSGYLFFSTFNQTMIGYIEKVKSRFKTLFIPFVFWNMATLGAIAIAQSIPATASYFSGRNAIVAQFDGIDLLNAIFGFGRMPISYQFWFIRDLIALALISPFIFSICKYAGTPFLLSLLALWLSGYWPLPLPSGEAVLFFSTGCWLAIGKKNLFMADANGMQIAIVYVFAAILAAAFNGSELGNYTLKFSILVGVITILWLTKFAVCSEIIKQNLIRLGQASFFVYAAHEPLLTICRKLAFKVLQPQSPHFVLVLYFAIPGLVISLIASLYPRFQSMFPKFMAAINGGR